MTIKEDVAIMKVKVDDVHRELMGNGRKGLLKEWSEHKGTFTNSGEGAVN